MPKQVRLLASQFRPPAWRPRLAQPWIEVKPNVEIKPNVQVQAPIKIELGGLPLSIGLFAGAGLVFLVRGQLPKGWPQTATLVLGAGLGVAGIANLMFPKAPAIAVAAPAPPPVQPPPPSGAVAPEQKPQGFTPSTVPAFMSVQFEVVSPQPDQEIEHLGWMFTSNRIPVVMRLYNPTAENVSFNLEFEWDEFPSVIGYNRAPSRGTKAFQVTLGPNEERNQQFELPMVTGLSTSTTVSLAIYKKRTPDENRMLVATRTFSVT